jgi:hypothetical protein
VTWTKLGDELRLEARDLSDAAFRTHIEALLWSGELHLDLRIPEGDLYRFAESGEAGKAAEELVSRGWWRARRDGWYIGCRHPEWQPTWKSVEATRAAWRDRSRRRRRRSKESNKETTDPYPYPYPDTRSDSRSESRSESLRESRSDETGPDLRFQEFWAVVWRQVGEEKARVAWSEIWRDIGRDIGRDVTPDEVIDAAARFTASCNGVPRNKLVWPYRWLAERWYLDYPPDRKIT